MPDEILDQLGTDKRKPGCNYFLWGLTISVETLRLSKLQQSPSHIQRLLEALVVRAKLVPEDAYQVRLMSAMPKELRRVADLAVKAGRVWVCWAQGFRAWLFTAEMPLALSRERGTPVMQVEIYDEGGAKDSGLWTPDQDGTWQRCGE
jgi:hypothetical protein